jgi:hypothetical protein
MNRRFLSLIIALLLILTCTTVAFAESYDYWNVRFTTGKSMGGNVTKDTATQINDLFNSMEPGDEESVRVWIINENTETTRWYMKNFVDRTLEEAGYNLTNGGAYSYKLTYQRYNQNHYALLGSHYDESNDVLNKSGDEQILYDSEDVGGENSISARVRGLKEATTNLDNYFVLDTLESHESGLVKLTVRFEGETQGNVYQNTIADIKMQFAVELANNTTSTTTRTAVRTGDDTNLIPYYIGMVVAGLIFLYLALDAYTDRLYKKGKG